MFLQHEIPPGELWERAKKLNAEAEELRILVLKTQTDCKHVWEKETQYDPKYSPFVDRRRVGATVIKGFRCSACNLFKPIGGENHTICRMCGGRMNHDRLDLAGMDRVHVYKCEKCGHEYDHT